MNLINTMKHIRIFVFFLLILLSPQDALTEIQPKTLQLSNGLILLLLERHTLPIVNVEVLIKAGSSKDPKGKEGLVNLAAEMLTEGTETRNANLISEEIDFIGGRLSATANSDYSKVNLTILKKDVERGFSLLSDVLINPAFKEKEFERVRNEVLSSLIQQKDEPATIAEKAFEKLLFGEHPYNHPPEGLEESLPSITRDDAVSFHKKYYIPNNAIIAIVGDVTEKEALSLLERYLGKEKWKKAELPTEDISKASKLAKKLIKPINKDITQANIHIGHLGISRNNPDFYAAYVMNYILGGGGFSSRLMKEIRDNQGLAYSISSTLDSRFYSGTFKVIIQTKNENANKAVEGILKELERIRLEPVSDRELAEAKSYLIGSFPLRFDTNKKVVSQLTYVEYHGIGLDYFKEFTKKIEAVTKEDVLSVARKYIDPERYILVVVANQEKANIKTEN